MLDPITVSLKMQQAAAISTMCGAGVMAAYWMRLLNGEHALLGFHEHRRAEEVCTHKHFVAKGAQWSDHYGKRSQDVDVEHMR